jgi:hypothetical protein
MFLDVLDMLADSVDLNSASLSAGSSGFSMPMLFS